MFVNRILGKIKPEGLLNHLNSRRPKDNFTMKIEANQQVLLLNVLVYKKENILDHTIYREKTHSNRNLDSKSPHQTAVSSLTPNHCEAADYRSQKLTGTDNWKQDIYILESASCLIANPDKNINRALRFTEPKTEKPEKGDAIAIYTARENNHLQNWKSTKEASGWNKIHHPQRDQHHFTHRRNKE